MNFVFFVLCCMAILPKHADIVVHDSYTVSRHFEKNVIVTGQQSQTASINQIENRIAIYLKIYTNKK